MTQFQLPVYIISYAKSKNKPNATSMYKIVNIAGTHEGIKSESLDYELEVWLELHVYARWQHMLSVFESY